MPRGRFDALRLDLVDGERVHVFGRPELFEARGDFRLRALSIERYGLGDHLAALERLKRKLAAEGLFARAQAAAAAPAAPHRARDGQRRGRETGRPRDDHDALPAARVLVAETYVQGPRAAPAIVDALRRLCGERRRLTSSCSPAAAAPSKTCCRSATSASCARSPPAPSRSSLPSARAGHAAVRPRCRRPRLDADRRRAAWSSRPRGLELARRRLERDAGPRPPAARRCLERARPRGAAGPAATGGARQGDAAACALAPRATSTRLRDRPREATRSYVNRRLAAARG